jgi:poly-gamma-glutamate capsule biosynthesis protein CapA/YwtB (metallophosphatase superfamily)
VDLAFVGDIMLGRSLARRIEAGNGGEIFASVESVLQSADITVGNLECAIGAGGIRAPKAFTFLAPPQSAALLRDAGFDLVALANNHILDYGLDVFDQTQALLTENKIGFVGAGADETAARRPVFIDAGGMKIAFLAYADVPEEYATHFDPRTWTAGPGKPGIAWADDETIQRDLLALGASPADFIVVLFHFGTEGLSEPTKNQIRQARMAIDYGADLVVGTHTHLVQGEETYKGGRIFYSLGNFVFDGFEGGANKSVILWINLSRGRAIDARLIPLTIVDGIPRIGE